eukprot:7984161-Pyramimonas_sp.AAC.1
MGRLRALVVVATERRRRLTNRRAIDQPSALEAPLTVALLAGVELEGLCLGKDVVKALGRGHALRA